MGLVVSDVRLRCLDLVWDLGVAGESGSRHRPEMVRLMDKILHDPKDPKLWELWYIPYYG